LPPAAKVLCGTILPFEPDPASSAYNNEFMILKQWFPKYGSWPKHGPQRVKKWVVPRGSKSGLCIFSVTTACLCLSVV